MNTFKERNAVRIGTNFEHIIASMDMFNPEWKMISATKHTVYHSLSIINRTFDLPFDDRDVQKHYALLESRTAMDVHAAEERDRGHEASVVPMMRWKY